MQVVATALRVLEEVITEQPVGVSELARRLDLPKSTIQRALRTLEDEGWLQSNAGGTRGWSQTPKILALASRGRGTGIREIALPVMQRLLAHANENVHLTARQGNNVVVVDKLESSHPVRVFDPIGTMIPLHASASGKALLAWSDEAEIREYLDKAIEEFTKHTFASPDDLRTELDNIRAQGYSYNRGEWRSEIKGIATVIREKNTAPRFAISYSIPDHRLPEENVPGLAERVIDAANAVADSL